MKPSLQTLKKNHYSSNKLDPGFVDGATLYQEIGHDIHQLALSGMSVLMPWPHTCYINH